MDDTQAATGPRRSRNMTAQATRNSVASATLIGLRAWRFIGQMLIRSIFKVFQIFAADLPVRGQRDMPHGIGFHAEQLC